MDVHTLTSGIDVLPTLLHVTGQAIPAWTEGLILPPYASASPEPGRSIYSVQAYHNNENAPLTRVTVALVNGRYKLVYYLGYPQIKRLERSEILLLFDIESDPDELVNLYSSRPEIAKEMLDELKAKLAEVDKPYL
jgi:arylsulfatase A-like enzyme